MHVNKRKPLSKAMTRLSGFTGSLSCVTCLMLISLPTALAMTGEPNCPSEKDLRAGHRTVDHPSWISGTEAILTGSVRRVQAADLGDVRRAGPGFRPDRSLGMNLVYIKLPKAASSTVSSVARRIAAHGAVRGYSGQGGRGIPPNEPQLHSWHEHMHCVVPRLNKMRLPVYLFSFVRHPVARAMSAFYHFGVTREQDPAVKKRMMADPAHKLKWLAEGKQGMMLNYLSAGAATANPSAVLDLYDFIGVVEQFDESLVALAMILRLSLGDFLYVSAKNSSTASPDLTYWADGRGRGASKVAAFVPHPSMVDEPEVVRNFARNGFAARNSGDFELYRAATARLNATIESLGSRYLQALASFRTAMEDVSRECRVPAATAAAVPIHARHDHRRGGIAALAQPGSPENAADGCYALDEGCGYKCVDRIAERHRRALHVHLR